MYSRKEIINAINNCLNENEQKTISARFGVGQEKSCTLNEIESIFNITREQYIEIEKKVLTYLRN